VTGNLVDSPRLAPGDRAEWERRRRYDVAGARALRGKPGVARERIEEWAVGRDEVTVAVSWGKDSVAVAHLALTSAVADRVRLLWVRQAWFENPDCEPVRDVFLAGHPGARYEERMVTSPHPRRWDDDADGRYRDPRPRARGSVWPVDRVTGIRAAESDARAMSANVHGHSTDRTCRPVIDWSTQDVFSFLEAEGLPVHPAYAMTTLLGRARDGIRVHGLGGLPGLRDRGPWEDTYYGRDIQAGRVQVACLRVLPRAKTSGMLAGEVHVRVSAVVPCSVPEVVDALMTLRVRGVVVLWERFGSTRWWRWDHVRPALPGTVMLGDLVGGSGRVCGGRSELVEADTLM
jgi:phosphoadenosine phosphosulfate reductase